MTIKQLSGLIDEEEDEHMQIFELEPLLFAGVKLTLEDRDTSIELKENVGIFPLEVLN